MKLATTLAAFGDQTIRAAIAADKAELGLQISMLAYTLAAGKLQGIDAAASVNTLQAKATLAGYTGTTIKSKASKVRAAMEHGTHNGTPLRATPIAAANEAGVIAECMALAIAFGAKGIEAASQARSAANGGAKGGRKAEAGTVATATPATAERSTPQTPAEIQKEIMAYVKVLRDMATPEAQTVLRAVAAKALAASQGPTIATAAPGLKAAA